MASIHRNLPLKSLTRFHFFAPMMPPEVVYPWSPPELPEVSWVSSLEQELSDLCNQHPGLASATNHRFQMKDYPEHDKVMVSPQFGDADLKEWLAGVSSPSPLPEMNNHQLKMQVLKGNTAAFLVVISEGGTGFGAHIMPLFGHQDVGMLHRALAQSLLEDKSYSVTEDDAASKQTSSDHKIKDFLKRSMPESSVKMRCAWGRLGPRKRRTGSTSWRVKAHKDTQRIVEQFKDKIINIYREKNKKKRRASRR
ncbi:hypothetical protein EJB05_23011, partial [Eragrostis curvula]